MALRWLGGVCGILIIAGHAHGQAVRYVDADAPAGGDGLSWATAFQDLQDALAPTSGAEEIWVASGTYKPAEWDVSVAFELRSGLAVYGGFRGDETLREQRDPSQHLTTLSGDLPGDDGPGFMGRWNNSEHIVVIYETDDSTILDGFRIYGGYADGRRGRNLTGGGILITDASPIIRDCRIEDCHASKRGGGIAVTGGAPQLINITVIGCRVEGSAPLLGGGLYLGATDARVENCLLDTNWSRTWGGGLAVEGGAPVLRGLEFRDNRAWLGGGGAYVGPTTLQPLRLEGGAFARNRAKEGGAVYLDGASLAAEQVTFEWNIADVGSAVRIASGTFASDGSLWTRNGADEFGTLLNKDAAIEIAGGELLLTGDRFVANMGSEHGGAITQRSGHVVCSDVEFTGNSSASGAAVWQEAGTLDIKRCDFISNIAEDSGGAVHSTSEGVVRIFNSRLLTNQARVGGAAALSNAIVANSVFLANTATEESGGALFAEGDVSIHNCTIALNMAATAGGGIRRGESAAPGLLLVANTVLWGNESADLELEPRQISVQSYSAADLAIDWCIVEGWSGLLPGEGTFDDDPMFVDRIGPDGIERSGDEDVSLAAGSPGRDAGANVLIAADLLDLDDDGDTAEPAPLALGDAPRRIDDIWAPDTGLGAAPVVDIGAWEHDTPPCRADLDGSGTLDIFDFLMFQNLFAAGDPRADFTGDGTLDFFDFLVFQEEFAAGCP